MKLSHLPSILTFLAPFITNSVFSARTISNSDILDAIKELKSIQSDKLNKILLHQRELDREYQATVDSVEDLKDEISNITGMINEKFHYINNDLLTSDDLDTEIAKVVRRIDDQEKKIARVVKGLGQKIQNSIEISANSGDSGSLAGNSGRSSGNEAISKTERPTNSENELTTQETIHTTLPIILPPIQRPDRTDNTDEAETVENDKTNENSKNTEKEPETSDDVTDLVTYTRPQLQKLFKFVSYDTRIRAMQWSAKRTNKGDKNGAVVYTQEFSMNTAMMFNITLKVKKLTSMEIGVCTERLGTAGSVWLGNSYKASVWYSGGAYFNSGKKSVNWPVYTAGDLITISYRPQTGTVSYLQNNDFVGAKTFKNRSAKTFMFCVTLYEDKDAVQIMKYYTLDFNSANRG